MPLSVYQKENLKDDFAPKILSGKSLPNTKAVSDGQGFFLEESDGVYVEHIMFNGKWNKKVVDANNNVVLEQV